MTVIFMDFPQNLSDHMPEKSDPIAHNGKQNGLVYRTWQNLLKFLQGVHECWDLNYLVKADKPTFFQSHIELLSRSIILYPWAYC